MAEENTWPQDAEGNPKAKITASISEKIPTVKYGGVDIFMNVTRFVDDDKVSEGLDNAYEEVDKALQIKHDEIVKELEEGN